MTGTVAVIGGSGFIGTRLCQYFSESNVDFKILDIKPSARFLEYYSQCDINDKEGLKNHLQGVSCVVNLAAEHKDNVSPVSLYYKVNVEGAAVLCDLCSELGIKKIVFTSSVAIYGLNKPNPKEDFEPDPFNHYGKSKLESEEVYEKWAKGDQLNALVMIRPTVVFGEENRGNVYNLLKQIHSKRFVMIGSGKNKKSIAYVGNVADFLYYNATKKFSGIEIYNYTDNPDMTMNEFLSYVNQLLGHSTSKFRIPYFIGMMGGYMLDVLSSITGKEFPIRAVRVKKFCATTQYNSTKVSEAGYKRRFTLQEGLKNTVSHEF